MYNFLTDPLIRVQYNGYVQSLPLPDIYAALIDGTIDTFVGLRPHQQHAWHAFLVQLGVIAMERAGLQSIPDDARTWHSIIQNLTLDYTDDEPWHLIVDDVLQPAFMQPPVKTIEKIEDYKHKEMTPDALDILVTAKNHDVKASVARLNNIDDWIFSLITLQTMAGYDGNGNYGISRMNGGHASRVAFSLAPRVGNIGAHVEHDILALLHGNNFVNYPMQIDGDALLWLMPWDGEKHESVLINRLHPLYIEVCRRVRLKCHDSNIYAVRGTSKAARIEGKALQGRTGDPWSPCDNKRDGIPLTLSKGGFTYRRVMEYLTSPNWKSPFLLQPSSLNDPNEPMQIVARGMVGGQGKTDGYYERFIPINQRLRTAMLRGGDDLLDVGDVAKKRINEIGIVQRILSHAIQTLLARGDVTAITSGYRETAGFWLRQLEEFADTRFFEDLQIEVDMASNDREQIHNSWLMNGKNGIVDHARMLLDDAVNTLPTECQVKASANARNLFEGRLRGNKGLPFLYVQVTAQQEG